MPTEKATTPRNTVRGLLIPNALAAPDAETDVELVGVLDEVTNVVMTTTEPFASVDVPLADAFETSRQRDVRSTRCGLWRGRKKYLHEAH